MTRRSQLRRRLRACHRLRHRGHDPRARARRRRAEPEPIKVDGIPPIPAALAARPRPIRSSGRVHLRAGIRRSASSSSRRERRTPRSSSTCESPLGPLVQLTDYAEPVRFGMWWPAKPDVLVFVRDAGGNEQRQVYRLDPGAKEPVLLTDAARSNRLQAMTRARDRLLVTSTDVDKTSGPRENPTLDLALVDPLAPDKARADRHAARHRLGRLLVLVRRPPARDDRVQVDHRNLRVGHGCRDRRAAPGAARRGRRRAARRSPRAKSTSRATARACSSRPTATANSSAPRISTSRPDGSNRSARPARMSSSSRFRPTDARSR